ncbi:MAG: hypothetical protein ACJAS1_005153 [Oleiphilaceae bacterium]|jgi:hypothetical protein
MNMRAFSFLLSLVLLIYPSFILAENWIQGVARMRIADAPIEDVREMTIKNAFADASFNAGVMVSSEEILLNGLLVNSKVIFRSQGMLRRGEVLSESIDNDILTVRVRADIMRYEQSCIDSKYLKKILITQFQLAKPKQASIGALYDFPNHVTKRFKQQLESYTNNPNLLLSNKSFTKLTSLNGIDKSEIIRKAAYLSRNLGYQFAVFGVIRDISTFNRVRKEILGEDVTMRRNFTVRLYVLDIYHKNIVYENSYHAEADWNFGINSIVDMNSSIFWQSDFGRVVLNTISSAIVDIDDVVGCAKTYGQIIHKAGDGFIINLGSKHGLKIGDKFSLNRVMNNTNDSNVTMMMIQAIPNSVVEVLSIDNDTALVSSKSLNASIAANLFDLLSPVDFYQRSKNSKN